MKRKIWFGFIILFSLLILFSDCCKEDEPEADPCPFSMSHYNRIKCFITSPVNGSILQSSSVTLVCVFAGTNPDFSFYFGTNPDTLPLISRQPVNSITINDLKAGTTYYWKFSAKENIQCGLGCGSGTSGFTIVTDINLPYITTTSVPVHINTSAPVGGTVLSEGASAVTERGVYWGSFPDPESTGTKLSLGSGSGAFSILLKGLDANTKYYVKAYATSKNGTFNGMETTFTTGQNAVFQSVSDIEGNVYKTLAIGTQTWMVENLKTTSLNDGTLIPLITDNIIWSDMTSKFTWHSNDPATYKNLYGALYNGFVVGSGKLCPSGWHVPSDSEWKTLEMYLGMSQKQADAESNRESDLGSQMKSTSGWPEQGNGFNTCDFSALPGGFRNPIGTFSDFRIGQWWSSTKDPMYNFLWCRSLLYNSAGINRVLVSMQSGCSVRCVKD